MSKIDDYAEMERKSLAEGRRARALLPRLHPGRTSFTLAELCEAVDLVVGSSATDEEL